MTTPYDTNAAASGHNVATAIAANAAADRTRMTVPTLASNRISRGQNKTTGVDNIKPKGHSIAFVGTTFSKATTASAVVSKVTDAEVGATYVVTYTSSGGGTPVTKSGTVPRVRADSNKATFNVAAADLHSLTAGTLTASIVLTDGATNAADAVTGAATLTA